MILQAPDSGVSAKGPYAMRQSLRLFSFVLAALTSAAAISGVPAFAQGRPEGAGGGLQVLEELNATKSGADSITSTMSLVEFEDKYCLPPDEPNKLKEEQWLKGREQTLAKYVQRFRALRPQFINLIKNDGLALKAVLGKLPDGANPIDDGFWQPWETSFKKAQDAIDAMRAELATKLVENCSPPPPPPPQPIDWLAGLSPPSFGDPDFPPLPKHHCSWDAYWALIRAIHPYYNKSAEDGQIASRYRDKVGARLVRAKDAGAPADAIAKLQQMFNAASQVAAERQKLSQDAAEHYAKAKRIPVIDCTPEDQQQPPADPIPQSDYEIFVYPQVPARFCSEAEKQAVLSQLDFAKAAARRNYEKAKAHVAELDRRLKGGDRTPGLAEALHRARQAETSFYNQWIELDRAYYKAQAMPVVDCRTQTGTDQRYGQSGGGLGANANVAFGNQQFPTFVYLGFENVLNVQTFGVENLDDDEGFTAFNAEAVINFDRGYRFTGEIDPNARAFMVFGFNVSDVNATTVRDEIDPLGQDLLLAFPTTPGIALGSGVPEGTPGGFNVVTDFFYGYNADTFSLYAKYGETWRCGDGAFTGYAGAVYTNLDQTQVATGDINGFLSDFRYNTDIDVDTWRIVGGVRYDSPSFAGFTAFAGATGSLNFVDASGRDSIKVSGFLNFSEAADLSKSDTTFGYFVDVGIATRIDEAAMDLYLAYRHAYDETTPGVVRHDNDPGHIVIEASDYDMIVAGARVRF